MYCIACKSGCLWMLMGGVEINIKHVRLLLKLQRVNVCSPRRRGGNRFAFSIRDMADLQFSTTSRSPFHYRASSSAAYPYYVHRASPIF